MSKEQLDGLVADAVVFLASESAFNVGSEITIDGGMSTL
jgi:hypothetical protein